MLKLRIASFEDAKFLFDWRNDPVTRSNFINTELVKWDDHVEWLKRTLLSPDRLLLVGEVNGNPVSTIRFDRAEVGHELSWTVAPEQRGRGIGFQTLEQAVKIKGPHFASIKEQNIASQRVAEKNGFVRMPDGPLVLRKPDQLIQVWERA